MKIIGGKYKGRNFYMPAGISPTQNITRKALFDIMGQDMTGLEFLELFAGSGAIGIEALSREARNVVFVEHDPKCVKVIEENLQLLKGPNVLETRLPIEVIEGDAFAQMKMFARGQKIFDIVFLDPPYGRELAKKALKTLGAYVIVAANSTVIVQHAEDEVLPETEGTLTRFNERQYGRTLLSFYKLTN